MADDQQYKGMILQQGGPEALQQWQALQEKMRPLQEGAALFPAAAIRSDLGTVYQLHCNNGLLRHAASFDNTVKVCKLLPTA